MRALSIVFSVFLFAACGSETPAPTTPSTGDASTPAQIGRVEYYEISKK